MSHLSILKSYPTPVIGVWTAVDDSISTASFGAYKISPSSLNVNIALDAGLNHAVILNEGYYRITFIPSFLRTTDLYDVYINDTSKADFSVGDKGTDAGTYFNAVQYMKANDTISIVNTNNASCQPVNNSMYFEISKIA